jgi:hypothetical protein
VSIRLRVAVVHELFTPQPIHLTVPRDVDRTISLLRAYKDPERR